MDEPNAGAKPDPEELESLQGIGPLVEASGFAPGGGSINSNMPGRISQLGVNQ